ncbi:MAG TPA: phosphatase PAP2 family protein [Candidatus Bathyarchaeia archaeon]|nr:phosphatase PAP2 family protein [Candidatus Bathyarchaeia archaeon]
MNKPIKCSISLPCIWTQWIVKIRSFEFIILAIAFICITGVVAFGLTTYFDGIIARWAKSLQGNENMDIMMIILTSFSDVSTLLIIGVILTIIRRTRRMGLIFLLSMVFIAISIIYMKPVIGRQSSSEGFRTFLILPKHFALEDDSVTPFARDYSYPSNHVAISTALAFIVGFEVNKKSRIGGILIWAFPALIGISKLYLMQHYFTDIIGGFLLGLIISIITSNVMHLDQPFLMSRFKGKDIDNAR